MGRVITNAMSLSRAREATLGVLPATPAWFVLEPNNPSNFGETYSKTARSPISKSRGRRKGSTTDMDSGVEFEADLTLFHLRLSMEEFCFARAIGGDVFTPTGASSGSYSVPAVTAAQAGRMVYGVSSAKTLLYARGFATAVNNGLKVLGATVSTGATTISVAGVAAETVAASDFVELAVAGVRGATGDLQIDASGNLVSTALNFTTLGLGVGQYIRIGGVDALNQFATLANNGFARIRQIAANKLTLEKREGVFVADTGAGVAIDILYGSFVRDVPVDHADYVEWSTQFEIASPNLMSGGATGYEYAVGNWPNQLTITVPLTNKATMTCSYVGTNTTEPSSSRATGSANAKQGVETESFGTASDIARLRLEDVDNQGLTTDFKSITVTFKNNTSGEKVLGVLGPRYLNAGNLEVDVETQVVFTSALVPIAIRQNKTCGLEIGLQNGDGGALINLPTGTLGGGNRDYPANQSVLVNTTFMAHEESLFDFSMSVSFFPVLPDDTD